MNLTVLKLILIKRKISMACLAKMAGVSRQAVSLWFKSNESVSVKSDHLFNLANVLGIEMSLLFSEVAILDQEEVVKKWRTKLLWDGMYPSLEELFIDVARERPKAVARVAQVIGIFNTANILGKKVWKQFPDFKKYLHPAKRKQYEGLWELQKNLGLI